MSLDAVKQAVFAHSEAFRQVLLAEGYAVQEAEFDSDNNIWMLQFKFERANLVAYFDMDDPEFVKIDLPWIFDFPAEKFGEAVRVANETNLNRKLSKVFVHPELNDTLVTVEFLHEGAFTSERVLRYLNALLSSARFFLQQAEHLRVARN